MGNKKVTIRPFARLLTMLGDQLIKNEQIAVIELIKNAYDADADWVKVSFEGFTESFGISSDSKIVIEDNGCGMTATIIEDSWMNPATPNKLSVDGSERRTPLYQRIIQGEKGIGRYAMLKLGRTVKMTTRPSANRVFNFSAEQYAKEYTLKFDLSEYNEDFITAEGSETKGMYLDELRFNLTDEAPSYFKEHEVVVAGRRYDGEKNNHGTRIEISNLTGTWSDAKLKPIIDSFLRFGDLFSGLTGTQSPEKSFTIGLYLNGALQNVDTKSSDISLHNLLETMSVLQVTDGHYESKTRKFTYKQNGTEKEISLDSDELKGTSVYRARFQDKITKDYREVSDFGDFRFDFFVFDFTAKGSSRYALPKEAKTIIKEHRIYLLRDDIRVMPYGNPDNDWLQIEVRRGTVRAGDFLSNDQVVGRVKISKFGNPHLKDKTNREGLIEDGYYTEDFISVIQTFLSFLRKGAYSVYLENKQKQEQIETVKRDAVVSEINRLKDRLKDDKPALAILAQLEKTYKTETKYLYSRADQTESLAAVGLSVETASHDIMMMLNKGVEELRTLFEDSQYSNFDNSHLTEDLQKLLGVFSYVQHQMKDMQMLFTSSKQRRRQLRVKEILDKVIAIYKRTLREKSIDCKINVIGSPLMAKCTDADLLQLLINLLDNAIYWLEWTTDRRIEITLDGQKGLLIFSDNGPGVKTDDKPYIFEPFYSGKGEEGRGLGLYISRKLLERNGYAIDLADVKEETILSGANFVVSFINSDNNGD